MSNTKKMASSESTDKRTSASLDNPHLLRVYLRRMREDESLHDVVFIVENERFPAHCCLIAAVSPVLRNMITNGKKEINQRKITLNEVNADVWKAVLNYMYTGRIDVTNVESALKYFKCAKTFQMKELEQVISNYIEEQLDASDCCEFLANMDCTNSAMLQELAMNILWNKFYDVCRSSEFTNLSYELVVQILGRRELIVRSELDVFLGAVHWVLCSGVNGVDSESNAEIAKQACEMLKQHGFEINGLQFVEPSTGDVESCSELFECVDISNLSSADLRRVARFCRDFCKENQKTNHVELVQLLREFGEKVVDKQLAAHNPIPNIPEHPCNRVPRNRYETVFTFSQRFDNVQSLIGPSGTTEFQSTPIFVDVTQKVEWYLKVFFRGDCEQSRNISLSCYLHRQSEEWSESEERQFGASLYVQIDDDEGLSAPTVFSKEKKVEFLRDYNQGMGWGYNELVPISTLVGKETIIVGATIYFKSK